MPKEIKHIPFEVKAEDIKEDGTFCGYGSISDSEKDSYGDIVAPGAFRKTLLEGGRNRTGIPMCWQHRSDRLPGVWRSMQEDSIGLAVEGQLALKTQLGADVYEIMRLGAELGTFQLGMSIGYDAVEVEYDKENNIRIIKSLNLWELSLVTHPAKVGAGVDSVKSIEEAKNIREIEDALRESGHTRTESQQIIRVIKESLRESEKKEAQKKEQEESLRESEIINTGLKSIVETIKEINSSGNIFSGILNK